MDRYRIDAFQSATQFLFSTVKVETCYPDGGVGAGTAFFFEDSSRPGELRSYLMTNVHVLEGVTSLRIRFHTSPSAERRHFTVFEDQWLSITSSWEFWTQHPDGTDLCAVSVNDLKALGSLEKLFFMPMASSAIPSQEEQQRYPAIMNVAMIGYPTGLWDEANNLPVVRRGTTATHPAIDFNGRPEVVVDMACFPGSSGSPVAFYDREYFASAPRFLGVLYAGPTITLDGKIVIDPVPTKTAISTKVETMIHLGYVIKARKVLELAQYIRTAN